MKLPDVRIPGHIPMLLRQKPVTTTCGMRSLAGSRSTFGRGDNNRLTNDWDAVDFCPSARTQHGLLRGRNACTPGKIQGSTSYTHEREWNTS